MATLNNKFKAFEEQLFQQVATALNVQDFNWDYTALFDTGRAEAALAAINNALPRLMALRDDPRLSTDLMQNLHVARIESFKARLRVWLNIIDDDDMPGLE